MNFTLWNQMQKTMIMAAIKSGDVRTAVRLSKRRSLAAHAYECGLREPIAYAEQALAFSA